MSGRIRTVKPEFFMHEGLFDLGVSSGFGPLLRLAFEGLWCQCDREGRFKWRPRSLKLAILPYDDCDFESVLQSLVKDGFVLRYSVDGKDFGWVPSFRDHQSINNREQASKLPPHPLEADASGTRASRVDVAASGEGNGTEGKGRERNAGAAPVRAAVEERRWGRSAEWDRCVRVMSELRLDDDARQRVESSPLDDMALDRLLTDVKADKRIKRPSAYVVKTLAKLEGVA